MPSYTLATVVSVVSVVALELVVFRTGVFRTARYWLTMLLVFAFQIPVDGWLTKLSDPIVIYNPADTCGIRWPWDIPVEDFGFGFAMVTWAILLWRVIGRRAQSRTPQSSSAPHSRPDTVRR